MCGPSGPPFIGLVHLHDLVEFLLANSFGWAFYCLFACLLVLFRCSPSAQASII